MGHRHYLPPNHKFQRQKDLFDGAIEQAGPPEPISIDEIHVQLKDLENLVLSKDPHEKPKISHEKRGDNWNKKVSSFHSRIRGT